MMHILTFILVFFCVLGVSASAFAYIGPGLGVVAIWALLGPIAAVVTVIAILAYFPLRYLYKKRQAEKTAQNQGDDTQKDDAV